MKNFFKKRLRFREWADLDRTKGNIKYLEQLFYYVFHPQELSKRKAQNFDKRVKQFNLNDKDIEMKAKVFQGYSLLFLLMVLGIWTYLIYNLFQGSYWICVTIFCISLVPLSLAFRFNFYFRVLQSKKLDYSLKDWIKDIR